MTGDLIAHRYRLGPTLGQGGMGTIYRAHDEVLDRPVAVKVLNRAGLGTAGRARLLAEARSAARLNHPNIVSVYDAGETDGLAYIVMELVEGDTLQGRGDLPGTVALVRQICAALAHAHAHGVIHRDLKPENVLVSADGTAKLSDFGLARSVSSRLTEDGAVAGTVFYLAPEILQGREIDGRADLYALGVMLYELTTGKLPFAGEEPVAIISQHLYAAPMPPRAHNPALPTALEAIILRLLAKDPVDRPATADEVSRLLEHWDDDSAEPDRLSLLDRMVRGRMVGRERELAEASAAWRRTLSGGGHVLLVSGEPGIGKTRLVRELSALARVSGAAVLRGECYVEGGMPYAPLAQILHAARDAGLLPLPGEPAGADGAELSTTTLRDLLSLAPELLPAEERSGPWLDAQAQQVRQFEAAAVLVQRLTTVRPLLIVLEDAHWADSGTLAAVRHLARRTQQSRVLIVVTYRETELDAACCLPDLLHDLQRERLATRVKLGRLGREQVRRLLAVMFGLDEDEINLELLDGLYRETEGNPFFLEEVCKALVEDGQIYYADGSWRRAPSQALQIPQSVRLTIQARLSKLPEPAQDLLRLAAVFGREFDFDTLQSASGVAEPALIEALEHASRAQIVSEVRNGHGLEFTFAHALIPSTLRESMSGPRLRLLHRRAVAAIEQRHPNDLEALAYHTSQAGDDDRALGYFRRAGERALSAYANQEAERHFHAALALCALRGADEALRAPLKTGLGEALFRLSRFAEARRMLSEAADDFIVADNPDRAAAAVARSARAAWYEDDTALALRICLDGLKRIAPEPATPGLSALLHETGRAYLFAATSMQDPPAEAAAYCRQGLELAERFSLVEIQAECLTTLGLTIGQGTDEALVLFRQAIALTEPSGLLATAARAYFNLGGGQLDLGLDLRAGVEDLRHASDLYRRAGQVVQALEVALLVADYDLTLGGFAEVERALAMIRQEARTLPQADHLELASAAIEVDLLTYRGEFDRAATLLSRVTDHADRLTRRSPFVKTERLLLSRAILGFERNDPSVARAAFEAAIAESKPGNPGDAVAPVCLLAMLDIRAGDFAAAEERIADARRRTAAATHQIFAPIFVNWAEAELATAQQRQTDAIAQLEEAIALTARFSARWFEARLRETCAAALEARRGPGDVARAVTELETIIPIYEALGATRHVARARAALGRVAQSDRP